MIQKISAPISVCIYFNHKTRSVAPRWVIWEGRTYAIKKIDLHHTLRQERTLYHVFSVETDVLFFRLVYNTDTLHWMVEEIANRDIN
jgi:hypothetical protein